MEYKANSGIWGTMFGVPCVVADNFLKLATGQQLKVLLYLLRCSGRSCSDEEISLNTGVSPQEAADAVLFWQQVNVLTPQRTSAEKVPELSMNAPAVQYSQPSETVNEVPDVQSQIAPKAEMPKRQDLHPSEIAKVMNESSDISELFKVAESALGKLNHTQQNSLIWMYNYLGLKKEVIVTLLFYCIRIGKTNSGYIEKIAYSWSENDINTLAAADEEVQRMCASFEYTDKIMKMFEMNRRPTPRQAEFINDWKQAGFRAELIQLAYEKTIDKINKLSFDYINKILLSWKDSGFTTADQVRSADDEYRKKKAASSGGKYTNGDDIEKYKAVINKF